MNLKKQLINISSVRKRSRGMKIYCSALTLEKTSVSSVQEEDTSSYLLHRTITSIWITVAIIAGALLFAPVHAALLYDQDFETDTAGWFAPNNFGSIEQVSSGTNGVTSFEGNYHALLQGEADPNADFFSAPYTFFGGPAGGLTGPVAFSTSLAIYLDLDWIHGEGFDYSAAASRQDGSHLRDFIFHTYRIDDGTDNAIIVGGTNNSNRTPQNRSTSNHFAVTDSGWYLFEHLFYDLDGSLAVDLNLRDSAGDLLFTETRNNTADDFANIYGGNRYGWFSHVTIDGGTHIDAVTLQTVTVPEPASLALLGLGFAALGGFSLMRRRRV